MLGAFVLYALGRWGGRTLVLRYGRVLRVSEADLIRAEGWFEKYGEAVVFFGRMVPIARSIVSIPAGMMRMPMVKFTVLTTIGSALWNTLLVGLGWYLGANWDVVGEYLHYVEYAVILGIVAGTIYLFVRWRSSRSSRA